jgi:hypothetical protein
MLESTSLWKSCVYAIDGSGNMVRDATEPEALIAWSGSLGVAPPWIGPIAVRIAVCRVAGPENGDGAVSPCSTPPLTATRIALNPTLTSGTASSALAQFDERK